MSEVSFLNVFSKFRMMNEWPSELRSFRIGIILVQTRLGAWLGFGTHPYHEAQGDLRIE